MANFIKDGWLTWLFYIKMNSIAAILERWEDNYEKLCVKKRHLGVGNLTFKIFRYGYVFGDIC